MTAALVESVEKLIREVKALKQAAQKPPRDAWSPREVAHKLGLPYDTVLDRINDGTIGHILVGKHKLVPDAELQRFLAPGIQKAAS
ncbi:MAG TPA: excisionase family DNA-binding protein [Amycolatopsis sp.]|uniref:excisionase family DNA-binding protein n=1 Tax=Amycolatopsis sp. TaxID=37632 RepID=UPI002B494B79|nr:excisionase family DNA-binding protein [Amycolatopsis sp.]HKS46722.1 excisionase family DNA-binding protein [Amycolatopsis sp.]